MIQSTVIDASVDPEIEGQPCSYCGHKCEGYNTIDTADGPDVPLCVNCAAFTTPELDAIMYHIDADNWPWVADHTVPMTIQVLAHASDLSLVVHRLTAWWGCDCCGSKRHVTAPELVVAFRGGRYPGVWRLRNLEVCDECYNGANGVTHVAYQTIHNAQYLRLPVKAVIVRIGWGVIYGGLPSWHLRTREFLTTTEAPPVPTPEAPPVPTGLRDKFIRVQRALNRPPASDSDTATPLLPIRSPERG